MWNFQARKEFGMDISFKPLLCQSMREVVWDLSGEVARSVGGDHRFGGGQALPQRQQHLLEWCTNTNWYHLPKSTNYFCQCDDTEHC